MAFYTDVSSFANKISSYGKAVEGAQRDAVAASAEVAAAIIRTSGARYRIKGRRGAKWPLGAKVLPPKRFGGNWVAIIQAEPIGFWVLVEKGAKAHEIRPRRRATRKRRPALSIPNLGYFAKVQHPGIGPIGHPWQEAMALVERRCPEAYGDAVVAGTLAKVA